MTAIWLIILAVVVFGLWLFVSGINDMRYAFRRDDRRMDTTYVQVELNNSFNNSFNGGRNTYGNRETKTAHAEGAGADTDSFFGSNTTKRW